MAYTPRGGRPQGRGGFSPRGGVSKVSVVVHRRIPQRGVLLNARAVPLERRVGFSREPGFLAASIALPFSLHVSLTLPAKKQSCFSLSSCSSVPPEEGEVAEASGALPEAAGAGSEAAEEEGAAAEAAGAEGEEEAAE